MVNRQPEFDAKWKKLALEGDEEAIGQLVRVSLEMLYHFCFYRVGRNKHLCEVGLPAFAGQSLHYCNERSEGPTFW